MTSTSVFSLLLPFSDHANPERFDKKALLLLEWMFAFKSGRGVRWGSYPLLNKAIISWREDIHSLDFFFHENTLLFLSKRLSSTPCTLPKVRNKTYNFSVRLTPTAPLTQACVALGLGLDNCHHLPSVSHLHAAPLQTVLQSQRDVLPLICQG